MTTVFRLVVTVLLALGYLLVMVGSPAAAQARPTTGSQPFKMVISVRQVRSAEYRASAQTTQARGGNLIQSRPLRLPHLHSGVERFAMAGCTECQRRCASPVHRQQPQCRVVHGTQFLHGGRHLFRRRIWSGRPDTRRDVERHGVVDPYDPSTSEPMRTTISTVCRAPARPSAKLSAPRRGPTVSSSKCGTDRAGSLLQLTTGTGCGGAYCPPEGVEQRFMPGSYRFRLHRRWRCSDEFRLLGDPRDVMGRDIMVGPVEPGPG